MKKDIPTALIAGGDLWPEEESQVSVASSNNGDSLVNLEVADYRAGDHVRHAQFGNGLVVSSRWVKDDIEVVVAFNGAVKKLSLAFARLAKAE